MLVRGSKIFCFLGFRFGKTSHHFMECRLNDMKWAVASVAAIFHINVIGY